MSKARIDYGQDAPGVARALLVGGLIAAAGAAAAWPFSLPIPLVPILGSAALSGVGGAAVMWWSSAVGKAKVCDRMLDVIRWQGDERVLDVGCGRGLALVAAAKRLAEGEVVGVDIWSATDLSANSPDATLANAAGEGVAHRVKVETADARDLPFADGRFDAVISMTALHNLKSAAERRTALSEMVRVLKPDGVISMFDIFHAGEYARAFQEMGLTDVRTSNPILLWIVPGRRVWARKPRA